MTDIKAGDLNQIPSVFTKSDTGPLPQDIQKCHQIMKGLRLILMLKDKKIQKLEIANGGGIHTPSLKDLSNLPFWVQQHINILEGEKAELTKQHSDILNEVKYLKKVEREQSKVLLTVEKGETKESYLETVKAHVEEMRHAKRR